MNYIYSLIGLIIITLVAYVLGYISLDKDFPVIDKVMSGYLLIIILLALFVACFSIVTELII